MRLHLACQTLLSISFASILIDAIFHLITGVISIFLASIFLPSLILLIPLSCLQGEMWWLRLSCKTLCCEHGHLLEVVFQSYFCFIVSEVQTNRSQSPDSSDTNQDNIIMSIFPGCESALWFSTARLVSHTEENLFNVSNWEI